MTTADESKFFTLPKIIFYVLAITLFILAVRYVGKFGDISSLIVQIDPLWFALAIASQILTYVTNSMALSLLLKKTVHIKFITLFKLSVVIMFVNQALPTGGLSGNGYIFNQLIKRKVTATEAYNALITQIVCYYAAVLLALIFFYGCYLSHSNHKNSIINYTLLTGLGYFTLLGTLVITFNNKQTLQFLTRKLSGFPIIRKYVEKFKFLSTENDSPFFFEKSLEQQKICY